MFNANFKYYKSKDPFPDMSGVLDFNKTTDSFRHKVRKISINNHSVNPFYGFNPVSTWEIFEIVDKPGLLFIKNPFNSFGQRYWTIRCLKDYTKKPNKTNMDSLNLIPDKKEWWDMCHSFNNTLLIKKLRWVTLGYHHNWDTKMYSEDNKNEFPEDLREMSVFVANVLGFNNFLPQAAIVNYYHMSSTLSGHTDHSEMNLEAPLFSLSFGQTAIFLIGGKSKDDIAIPMFIRSGDIVVMSKESRLCYHGVPKILQMDSRYWGPHCSVIDKNVLRKCMETARLCRDEGRWKPFGEYLNNSRININIRQVLYNDQKRLSKDYDNVR